MILINKYFKNVCSYCNLVSSLENKYYKISIYPLILFLSYFQVDVIQTYYDLYYYLMSIIRLQDNPFFVYKIIILGDSGIGKTCLAVRYCEEYYPLNRQVTVGIDFKDKRIIIDEIKVRLNIFDTAGQQSYNSLVKSYYREVDAVIFAYAITEQPYDKFSRKSFSNVQKWVREFEANTDSQQAIKILVGTQSDLQSQRAVQKQDGLKLMQELGCIFFFQTSSKENLHIDDVFQEIARNLLLKMYKKRQKVQSNNKEDLIQILHSETEKNSKCC